ncbi:MAG: type II secretion system protein GspL [Pseudomonadota bacterium]|nr:type II secretion system protein GspL [Pseudomonadota bacterium]
MTARLYLRLPASEGAPAQWLLQGAEESLESAASGVGDPQQALDQAAEIGADVYLIAPGERVTCHRVDVPLRGESRIRRLVPFALEEVLPGEVTDYHFALGERAEGGSVPVVAVQAELMGKWVDGVRERGLIAKACRVDTLLLPHKPNHWTVLVESEVCRIRTGSASGYCCDLENLTVFLRRAINEADERPEGIDLLMAPGSQETWQLEVIDATSRGVPVHTADLNRPLQRFVAAIAQDPSPDLLQGAFRTETSWTGRLRPWWPVAAVAMVWLVMVMSAWGYDHLRMRHEIVSLEGEIRSILKSSFPQMRRLEPPRVRMEQALAELRQEAGDDRFLRLMAETAPSLVRMPGFALRGLRYQNRVLEMQVAVANIQALEMVREEMAGRALELSVVSASADGDGILSRITIREMS